MRSILSPEWCSILHTDVRSSRSMQSSNVKFFYHEKALSNWAFGPFQMASDTGCTEVIYQPGQGHLSRSLKQHNPLSRATKISWMTTIFPNPIGFHNRPVIIWKPIDTRLSITDPNRGWIQQSLELADVAAILTVTYQLPFKISSTFWQQMSAKPTKA